MHYSIVAAATLVAITNTQTFLAQTPPFNLIVLSSNATLNGTGINACHDVVTTESPCVGFDSASFTLNYTAAATNTTAGSLLAGCEAQLAACQSTPFFNNALCSSQFSQCLDAASTSLVTTCQTQLDACDSAPEVNHSFCTSQYNNCLGDAGIPCNCETVFDTCNNSAAIDCDSVLATCSITCPLTQEAATPSPVGILTYELFCGTDPCASEPMTLFEPTGSNVAQPLFELPGPPNTPTSVSFDAENKLAIDGASDQWYVCLTTFNEEWNNLAWITDGLAPQNPTCQKVDVVRVFLFEQ